MNQVMSTLQTFSTSQIQQASWFLSKFSPTGLADKLSIAVRILSPLNLQTVKESLQALTERHAILRSLYCDQDHQLIQTIQETVEVNF